MRRALELAALGLGRTSPNPAVGAVVVAEGRIVGEGYHRRAGGPHAEPQALAAAGERAQGATLYVTLEPCCHHGRTPPCTEAIIRAGIARVVYACGDCDARCAGQGARALQEAGIAVSCGPLTAEAERLNEAYFKHKRTGRPFVTLKMACSLDGKTATRTGDSRWVSGEAARERVHQMRDRVDAVMVGVGTILADDPQLTVRLPTGGGHNPLRVVVDSLARTPPTARVVRGGETGPAPGALPPDQRTTPDASFAAERGDEGDEPRSFGQCVVAVTGAAPAERVDALRAVGAQVLVLPAQNHGGVDLEALLRELGARGVMSVLVEGGATLAGGLADAGLIDKCVFFIAPRLIGGREAPTTVAGTGVATMAEALKLEFTQVERVGQDMLIEAYPCSPD